VDKAYELFCLANPLFYDSPTALPGDADPEEDIGFAIARGPAPEGWTRHYLDDWVVYLPEDVHLPAQGWKIHASACLDNAGRILAAVWDYCIPREIPFKFVRNLDLLLFSNGKYAHRGSSGKFITIYPPAEDQFEVILSELGAILEGEPGPYILSDLRWNEGPLYARYGGFTGGHYCIGANGAVEAAILDDSGQLVPDHRGPTFQIPAWVTIPEFLEPQLAARNSTKIDDLPYRIDEVIHFSNGGGLYRGTDKRTGEQVVLKEARPHAGLSVDRADAVTRLERERSTLARLAGLDVTPAVHDYFHAGGHHFLVLELVEGSPLTSLIAQRYPLTQPQLDEVTAAEYTAWAVDVCEQVERAVSRVHELGIAIGDVHPSNVLVTPDGDIRLIDFEVAADASEERGQALADPAFMPTDRRTGFAIDRYALACLRLFAFMPVTMLLGLGREKAAHLAEEIAKVFPVPHEFLASAVHEITGSQTLARGSTTRRRSRSLELDPTPDGWRRARDSMAKAITASATPKRDDRLFPGDVKQFSDSGGGINLAYGAAGVLYTLAVTGAARDPDHEEWLVRHATQPEPGTGLGFYDGLHGVAYALETLGHRADALKVLDIASSELEGKEEHFGLNLFSGLSGIALNLSHFAALTGDAALRDAAWRIADSVADRLGDEDAVPEISGGQYPYAGLLRGSAGPALLFLHLHAETGDPGLLDLAATALRQDLRRCMHRDEDGALEVNEGWRTMPYLCDGSVGIGLALDEYLARREDDAFAQASADARKAAAAQFYIEPGLFYGRAGMILYLSRQYAPGAARDDDLVAAQIRRLAWHAMTYEGQLAFPGEQLLRLSMDLASGTAGILLAVGAALHDERVQLPFFAPLQVSEMPPSDFAPDDQLSLVGGRR
jgi:tRNA A-37 threonylcarbamoyl transferase component Bud32